MNPWTMLASALQTLPVNVRRTLYTIVTAAGALLAIAQIAGWKTLGPIDLDQALKVYALISSPTGVLALANVKPTEAAPAEDRRWAYEGYDDRADTEVGTETGFPDQRTAPSDEASFS